MLQTSLFIFLLNIFVYFLIRITDWATKISGEEREKVNAILTDEFNSPKTKRNRSIWPEDVRTIRLALWQALVVAAVSIVDSYPVELPIPNCCTTHRWCLASDSTIHTNDLRKSMCTLYQSVPMFRYMFSLSKAITIKWNWISQSINAANVNVKLPFSSNINSATVLDHSWAIALKKPAILLCHSRLYTTYIFSNSTLAPFTLCGIRFHRKRALQLYTNTKSHFKWI